MMAIGADLAQLTGYPFEVRYSEGALARAGAIAAITADAYDYFRQLFSGFEPDLAVIIVEKPDWESKHPYGPPYFNDGEGQVRPGIMVMPAGRGDFWVAMGEDLRGASPRGFRRLLATYPDGAGGLDLQPFFDLVTVHELGHAFESLGGLRLPAFWLGEMFADLALHAFIATSRPESLNTLEVLPTVGAQSRRLATRMRADGFSTLEELEGHYMGGDNPMNPLNYVWYQYRWLRLAAKVFNSDGENALIRFWGCFHAPDRISSNAPATLAPLLRAEVSETLGRVVQHWR